MTELTRPPRLVRFTLHGLIYALALSMVAPMLWVISTSLKTQAESLSANPTPLPAGPPTAWAWSNYAEAWSLAEFGRFYGNSLLVAIVVTALSVAHNALARKGTISACSRSTYPNQPHRTYMKMK